MQEANDAPLPVVLTEMASSLRGSTHPRLQGAAAKELPWSSLTFPRCPEPASPTWQDLLGER